MEKICIRNAPHLDAPQGKGVGFLFSCLQVGFIGEAGPIWPEDKSVRTRRQEYPRVVSRGANRLDKGTNRIHCKVEMNMLNILICHINVKHVKHII